MATVSTNIINTLGASDLDTKTLTTNLVEAVKAPRQKLIDTNKKKADVAVSTTAMLKNALSVLQSSATDLGSIGNLNKLQISNSDSSSVSVSSGGYGAAIPGNYSVNVTKLAKAQRTVSTQGFASGNDTLGTGFDLKLTTGTGASSVAKTIRIAAGATVNSMISAINTSGSDVTARLVNTGITSSPYKILLQGKSGLANSFAIEERAIDAGAALMTTPIFSPGAANLQNSDDATFELNGIPMSRSSNTITDAVDGLSIQLSKVTASPAQVDVSYDSTQVVDSVTNFVQTFNYVTDLIVRATGQPKTGDEIAGTLQNDSTARSVRNILRSKLTANSSSPSGTVNNWVDLGVSLDRDGVLQFDKTIFNKKFASVPQDAIRAMSNNASSPYIYSGGASGLAGDIAVSAYGLLKTGGTVASMTTSYDDKIKKITDQQTKLDAEMEKLTSRYEQQFSSLNAVLANFKSTQTRLTAMLNNNKSNN